MHELALCEAISRSVSSHAAGARVRSVQLRIGALRQVVPETLSYCWSVVSRGALLDGSELVVELVPGEVLCTDCQTRTTLDSFRFACAGCGGKATRVVAGEELLIVSIEIDDPHGSGTTS